MSQADVEGVETEAEFVEEPEVEEVDPVEPGEAPAAESTEAEPEEVVVTIGEEESPPSEEVERAPEWVRELRKSNREKDRRIRELEEQAKTAKPAEKAVEVGDKPSLESCEYDEAKFETELEQWHERKRVVADKERKKQADGEAAQKAWQAKLDTYGKQKSELKVKDYDEAEAIVLDAFNVTQQGIIVSGADNAAIVNYALSKNPARLKALASITDPVKFAFAVAKLETQMKVTPRKSAPVPETTVRGNARVSAGIDSTLERLRAEADRSGDRTKVAAYIREQSRARTK